MFVEEECFFKNGNGIRVCRDTETTTRFSFLYTSSILPRCVIEVFGKNCYYLICMPFTFPIEKSIDDFNIAFDNAIDNRKKRLHLRFVKAKNIKRATLDFYTETIEKFDVLKDVGL